MRESGLLPRRTVVGPLLTLSVRCAGDELRGKGTPGQAGALHLGGRRWRADSPAMLDLVARRRTRFVRCAHCARTAATSQSTKRAARAARSPALLGASQARPNLPGRTFAGASLAFVANTQGTVSRRAVPGRGDFCGDEKRRAAVGARSALRRLTRRSCPNAANAVREVSSATRPQAEHRSAVGAQRRPPQHEPLPGAAWRDARRPHESGPPNDRNGPEAGLRESSSFPGRH
jgi:hypothetical protein